MYTRKNYKSKAELKRAVAAHASGEGEPVRIYAPGLGTPKENGTDYVEGPHYPAAHTWYAQVTLKDGVVIRVK